MKTILLVPFPKMKNLFLSTFSFLVFILGNAAGQIYNVSYGADPAQIFDLYLPTVVRNDTRILILIHGGGWDGGDKGDAEDFVPYFKAILPSYYVANLEYRLGTIESPGLPKQLEDIDLAIKYLMSSFDHSVSFALMGGSAGGHLAMLYGYTYDLRESQVKIVVDQVGPSDLTDPNYTNDPAMDERCFVLVGPCLYTECPERYRDASPVYHVKAGVPPTIGFYGNADPLIPNSQMPTLKNTLDEFGVVNKFTVYEGGHGDWSINDKVDMVVQMADFIRDNWSVVGEMEK